MATDVAAPFPDVILAPGTTITVRCDDASAVISKLNVYGVTPRIEPLPEVPTLPPYFAYGADATG